MHLSRESARLPDGKAMPYYQNINSFKQCSTHDAFNLPHGPKAEVRIAGIYRCDCGFEFAVNASDAKPASLPAERNCRNHANEWKGRDGVPVWLLVAAAIHQVS